MLANVGRITQAPAILDPQVAALAPAQLLQRLLERRELGTAGAATAREHADPPYAPWLLRARHERPRDGRAAEQRDEVAALHLRGHSIPSSARDIKLSENFTPSALAVLRLITNSNLVGCMTGRSAGLAPFRTRPA